MKIICEKEYYSLTFSKPDIAMVMMVKNEEARIHVSLESVKDYVKAIIIYDTGSTDNTISIIQNFCKKNKINLYLIQGEFVNFYVSRNVLLEYAEKIDIHYLLLMDSNDELKDGKNLNLLAIGMKDSEKLGFLIRQHWYDKDSATKYFNIRFIKNRKGWRYKGVVHEWLESPLVSGQEAKYLITVDTEIELYQNRMYDAEKSFKRFEKDRLLLLEEVKNNPSDSRSLYYLAQTCENLGLKEEAIMYSKLRIEQEGYIDEKFHSYMRIAQCSIFLNHSWYDILGWYTRAIEEFNRVEPYVQIANHYAVQKIWPLCYMYAFASCKLKYPTNTLLFVDNRMYEYTRYRLVAIAGFYVEEYEEGEKASHIILKTNIDPIEDKKILQFYLDKKKEK